MSGRKQVRARTNQRIANGRYALDEEGRDSLGKSHVLREDRLSDGVELSDPVTENIATVACAFVLRAPTLLFGCAESKHVFPKVLQIFLNIVAEEEVGAVLCCREVLLPVLIKV